MKNVNEEINTTIAQAATYPPPETLKIINRYLEELYKLKLEELREGKPLRWDELEDGDILEVTGAGESLPKGYRGKHDAEAMNDEGSVVILDEKGNRKYIAEWRFVSRPSEE